MTDAPDVASNDSLTNATTEERHAMLGMHLSDADRAQIFHAAWANQIPGSRPTTPLNGTRAQVTTEAQGRFWAIPLSIPWLPVDYEGGGIIMMLAQAIRTGYALCDNCATTDCSRTGIGRIVTTYRNDPVSLRIGSSEARLE